MPRDLGRDAGAAVGGKAGQGLAVAAVLFAGYLFFTGRLQAFAAILRYGPGGPTKGSGGETGDRSMEPLMPAPIMLPNLRAIPMRDPGVSAPGGGSGILATDITGPKGTIHLQIRKDAYCYAEVAAAGLQVGLTIEQTAKLADDLCR